MEQKTNKNWILITIIIIMMIIIIGLSLMLFIKNESETNSNENDIQNDNIKKDESEQLDSNDEKEEIIEKEVDEELVNNLMDIFNNVTCGTISSYYPIDNTITYDDLPEKYKYDIVLQQISKTDVFKTNDWSNADWDYKYDGNELDEKYYELFGYDKEINLKKISKENAYNNPIIVGGYVLYFENNDYYSISATGCGSGYSYNSLFKIVKTQLKNDILEITFKYALVTKLSGENMAYLYDKVPETNNQDNYIGKIDCTNSEYNFCDSTKENNDSEIVTKYYDKLNTYKYTFKYDSEHNNYYFNSLEKL